MVAAFLAATTPDKILACRELFDGALVVVVSPGPKFTFLPEEVENARILLNKIALGQNQAAATPPVSPNTPSEANESLGNVPPATAATRSPNNIAAPLGTPGAPSARLERPKRKKKDKA